MNILRGSIAVVVFWAIMVGLYFQPNWFMYGLLAVLCLILSACLFFVFSSEDF